MTSETKPQQQPSSEPETYQGVTPYLYIKGAAEALEFYKKAFGASESLRMEQPDGRIGHAEIKIGDAPLMLADEFPEIGVISPQTLGGSTVALCIPVKDVDSLFSQAVAAGCKVLGPLADQFYGERNCKLQDPFGHIWSFSTHIEDVSVEEMQKRSEALYPKG
jgi:PhnB protein